MTRRSLLPARPVNLSRHRLKGIVIVAAAAFLAVLLGATMCSAAAMWNPGGVAISTAFGSQYNQRVVPDGAGGAFVVFSDYRNNTGDIFAQRVNANGTVLWTTNGVPVAYGTSDQYSADLCSDGAGGIIVAWQDNRNGGLNDIYAQRLNGAGHAVWAANGVPVDTTPGFHKQSPACVSDGAGGAIITSTEWVGPLYSIYAQRIAPSGATVWGSRAELTTRAYEQNMPAAVTDGDGGAIVSWVDGRNGTTNYDIYSQKVDGAGTVLWAADGSPVCVAPGVQSAPQITTDAADGAIIVWQDGRSGSNNDVFGQRMASGGTRVWGTNGTRVCGASGNQRYPELAADGSGGAVVTWEDNRSSTAAIYAQKLTSGGGPAPGWASNGVPIATRAPGNFEPVIVSDGSGGAIISWSWGQYYYFGASSGGDSDLFVRTMVQQVLANGTISPGWGPNGAAACTLEASNINAYPQIVTDGAGGAVVVFEDYRSTDTDLYAQRMRTTTSQWYLAEGSTAWGYQTYMTIENPNPVGVTAKVTYMTPQGSLNPRSITLPAASQTTISPMDDLKRQTDFSTRVECVEGKPIAVDRTMTWTGPGAPSPEGHSSVGVNSPASNWYLPEGSSGYGFECWLLIQNPDAAPAKCTLMYMIEGGKPVTVTKTVPANSRQSFNMADDIGQQNASMMVTTDVPVVVERSMYRNNRREGHESIGATESSTDYFLAEGTTAWGFETYVLVQNPNESPCFVSLTYMTPAGPVAQPPFSMPGYSRKTVKVSDALPNTDFSTQVHSDQPVVAERAMYWGEGTACGEAMHDSVGVSAPHRIFYLPDGQTSEGRETYTLVQNPNGTAVDVKVTYLTPDGKGDVYVLESVPALSRMTFDLAKEIPSGRAGIMVECTTAGENIIVERVMYWNSRGAGTVTIGGSSD